MKSIILIWLIGSTTLPNGGGSTPVPNPRTRAVLASVVLPGSGAMLLGAKVRGEVLRSPRGPEGDYSRQLESLIGVRVGPGMLKIIEGLIPDIPFRDMLAYMVEECCHGVILSFTKDVLLQSPRPTEPEAEREFYSDMVRKNIRLYNRCAAFAPGSSLVEGIEPPSSSAIRS